MRYWMIDNGQIIDLNYIFPLCFKIGSLVSYGEFKVVIQIFLLIRNGPIYVLPC